MKKILKLLVLLCLLFIYTDVYAESVKMQEGDYELVCTYNDGLVLTISKTSVFLQNNSTDQSSLNTDESVSFYLGTAANEYDANGEVLNYNSYKILENDKCPKKLYPYVTVDEVDTGEEDSDGDTIYEDVYHYYYATKADSKYKTVSIYRCYSGANNKLTENSIESITKDKIRNIYNINDYEIPNVKSLYDFFDLNGEQINFYGRHITISRDDASTLCKIEYGNDAYAITDSQKDVTQAWWGNDRKVVSLLSEEAYLTSKKTTKICDYESVAEEATSTANTASIYLYDNVAFLEMGGRVTPLANKPTDCPYTGEEGGEAPDVYINDPSPKSIAGNSANLKYNTIRYKIFNSNEACKEDNDGNDCVVLKYIGARHGDGDISGSNELCAFLGNKTATLIRDIVNILRILVPALVLVLIGLDITKMVLAGNLEDELPKKKKSIIIRLIIMVLFFFLPLFVVLIIDLINLSPDINIGDVSCLFLK